MEDFARSWWPQITAFTALVFYTAQRHAAQDERTSQLEKKVEQLYVLWNKHMDWLLNNKKD